MGIRDPYGGFHSFDHNSRDDLEGEFSFNFERLDVEEEDATRSRQHLLRYDCNEFLHGKAS